MLWSTFIFMCYLFVVIHSKRYDTARNCMAFVPGIADPNLYRNINFITEPIKFNNSDINPKNHHIIPATILRKFFNSALHSNIYRVPFIRVLELSHFGRGRYLQNIPDDVERFVNDSEHVRFNICESNHFNEISKESRDLITRALDHYGRFVRTMFILMPFNLVEGPEKRCGGGADVNLDEELQYIVGHDHFKNLKDMYDAMKRNDLGYTIHLLFTMFRKNFIDRPYEYHEHNWRYDAENDCFVVVDQQNLRHKMNLDKNKANSRWYTYGVQFSFSIGGKQYMYAQNTDTRHWFIQKIYINGNIGDETDNGRWENVYHVQFPFSVEGKQYFYAQNTRSRYWFIQELLSNGKMGKETANGHWDNVYRIQFPFSSGGKQYFYGQNAETKFWFIQELLPNGKMGIEITNGVWSHVQDTHTKTEL